MRMKMEKGWLYIIETDNVQSAVLKSWYQLRWNKGKKWWEGQVCAELLNKLKKSFGLPKPIDEERERLNAIQKAVDAERILPAEKLKPMVTYPVTKALFAHQTRAANMALMTFGLVEPPESRT